MNKKEKKQREDSGNFDLGVLKSSCLRDKEGYCYPEKEEKKEEETDEVKRKIEKANGMFLLNNLLSAMKDFDLTFPSKERKNRKCFFPMTMSDIEYMAKLIKEDLKANKK